MVYVFNPDNSSVYVMDIFISATDIHEDMIDNRHYTSPILHDVSLNEILPFLHMMCGMHYIRFKLIAPPLSKLHSLYYDSCLENPVLNPIHTNNSLQQWHRNITHHILFFKRVGNMNDPYKRLFLKLQFAKKDLDVTNLDNILNMNMSYTRFIHINGSYKYCFCMDITIYKFLDRRFIYRQFN